MNFGRVKVAYLKYLEENILDMEYNIEDISFLFHRMNTKSSIYTSGAAMSENNTFSVHEWNKILSYTKKTNFLFLVFTRC